MQQGGDVWMSGAYRSLSAGFLVTTIVLTTSAAGALTVLHAHGTDGISPYSAPVRDASGALYGTTFNGGSANKGTIYAIYPGGTYAVLHSFVGGTGDGVTPYASLAADGAGNLYGMAPRGGLNDKGVIFKIKIDGTGFTVLHSFAGGSGDGALPDGGVTLDGSGFLYGTTTAGGTPDQGVVFKMATSGGPISLLHTFSSGTDGALPATTLALDGSGFLYGTTALGGLSNLGTVFKIKKDASGYAVLHPFAGGTADGMTSPSGVVADGSGNLYGTTYAGGLNGLGVVYTLKNDGTGFALLRSFAGGNGDGSHPSAALALDGAGNLFGATLNGGLPNLGVVFRMTTAGGGFAILHLFQGGSTDGASTFGILLDGQKLIGASTSGGPGPGYGTVFELLTDGNGFALLHTFTAGDGISPNAAVVTDGLGNLYFTTDFGGASGLGTVATMRTDGTGYAVLHPFSGGMNDGSNPLSPLLLIGDTLYGTTTNGGSANAGVVFEVKTDGTGFGLLYSFAGGGSYPHSGLTQVGPSLWGTTYDGYLYKIETNGTGFVAQAAGGGVEGPVLYDASTTTLYFTTRTGGTGYGTVSAWGLFVGGTKTVLHTFQPGMTDGGAPFAGLVLDGSGNLFGTTEIGGVSNKGVVYTLKTNGTGFAVLHSFDGSDGELPHSPVVLDESSGYLYGTTPQNGGSSNAGTVYRLKKDGAAFSVLHTFTGGKFDGANSYGGLLLDGNGKLLGSTFDGGWANQGVEFSLDICKTGDVDGNGVVTVSDVFYLINYLFAGGPAPLGCANVNGDQAINVSDVFYLINYLFAGGPPPV